MTSHEQPQDPTDVKQEIASKIKDILDGTCFAVSDLRRLSGGTANFIYHATLKQSSSRDKYQDGVVVKHGEGYVASYPSFKISTSRCAVEYESLIHLAALPPLQTPHCMISTPKTYYFNQDTNTQVQEYLPHAISLKEYALEHYSPSTQTHKPQCDQLGHALGAWLRAFHGWSQEPKQAAMRETFAGNKDGQGLKSMINYQRLLQMVDQHPDVLGDARDVLQGVSDLAAGELLNETDLCPIHGDFWTGNVLISDVPVTDSGRIPVRVVDWEMSQLGVRPVDLGQFIAELWSLKLYRNIDAGEWLIRAFAAGYGLVDDTFAYRAIIHVGIHIICFGSYWSITPGELSEAEQRKIMIKIGKEVILKAWSRDREYFRGHLLGCLFG
ncbi:hypothetical protein HYE68_009510 [Fusarium pseudograminearum]|nr:hypothetical protein HYE68_009510 [Fusarium pseudograminearum]